MYIYIYILCSKSCQITVEMSSKVCRYQQAVQMLTNIRKKNFVPCFPPLDVCAQHINKIKNIKLICQCSNIKKTTQLNYNSQYTQQRTITLGHFIAIL